MPRIEAAEGKDHDGCQAGILSLSNPSGNRAVPVIRVPPHPNQSRVGPNPADITLPQKTRGRITAAGFEAPATMGKIYYFPRSHLTGFGYVASVKPDGC